VRPCDPSEPADDSATPGNHWSQPRRLRHDGPVNLASLQLHPDRLFDTNPRRAFKL
jgi:hypothetical protein